MKLDEHQQIIQQLSADSIDGATKINLLKKLSDDYGVVQADILTTTKQVESLSSERDRYAELSKQLWLENSAQLTGTQTKTEEPKGQQEAVLPKRSYADLEKLF